MLQLPTIAQAVRVVGGPTGSDVGPIGPTGLRGGAAIGATGVFGPTGYQGTTGATGAAGSFLGLLGAIGHKGPTGSNGYPGSIGVVGSAYMIPPPRFRYFENRLGLQRIGPNSVYSGCKFGFTLTNSGNYVVLFTGLAENAANESIRATIFVGRPPAPVAGDSAFSGIAGPVGNSFDIFTESKALDKSIPFTCMGTEVSGFFDGESLELWFDLYVSSGSSASAIVRNISCVVFEL